jgi:hypothetical protein
LPPDEELFEGEDLPPVAQGVVRQQTHLGERVEDDALGLRRSTSSRTAPRRLAELDLGGWKMVYCDSA